MITRHALAAASALLLLVGTATGSLASGSANRSAVGSAATRPGPAMVVRNYFDALDRGLIAHNFQALHRMYARDVALTESMTAGRPHVYTGFREVLSFDHSNGLNWYVTDMEQLSPNVVLAIEHPSASGPGHEAASAGSWLTLFTIRNGWIANIVWMPC
jgi:hypothetical protein